MQNRQVSPKPIGVKNTVCDLDDIQYGTVERLALDGIFYVHEVIWCSLKFGDRYSSVGILTFRSIRPCGRSSVRSFLR